MGLTFELPALPIPALSPNAYSALPTHWMRAACRAAQRGDWLILLREALGPGPYPTVATPVTIGITLRGTGRRTDVPNLVAHVGLKVLIDCLTERSGYGLGILPDDSVRYVTSMSVTVIPNGEPATIVAITGVDLEVVCDSG